MSQLNQRVSIKDIDYDNETSLEQIANNSAIFALALKQIVVNNAYYVKEFLKRLIDRLENYQRNSEENECEFGDLYDLYVLILQATPKPPESLDVVQYRLNEIILIKLQPRLMSGFGSTGFRTWNALLYLSEYLLEYFGRHVGNKKVKVVELGAGTGLVSLTLVKNFSEKIEQIYITDGGEDVLQRLQENFKLNGVIEKANFMRLMWGSDDVPKCDILLAADVTYDPDTIEALASSIHQVLTENREALVLVAATIRQPATIEFFHKKLSTIGLSFTVMPEISNRRLFYDTGETNIKIYNVGYSQEYSL